MNPLLWYFTTVWEILENSPHVLDFICMSCNTCKIRVLELCSWFSAFVSLLLSTSLAFFLWFKLVLYLLLLMMSEWSLHFNLFLIWNFKATLLDISSLSVELIWYLIILLSKLTSVSLCLGWSRANIFNCYLFQAYRDHTSWCWIQGFQPKGKSAFRQPIFSLRKSIFFFNLKNISLTCVSLTSLFTD